MNKLTNLSVLVIDDEPLLREILRELLEDEGAAVNEADCADAARRFLASATVDVIVSDIRMPGEDGLSLLSCLSPELEKRPLLFFCTGMTQITQQEAHTMGATEIFLKPFDGDAIVTSIAAAVLASKTKRL